MLDRVLGHSALGALDGVDAVHGHVVRSHVAHELSGHAALAAEGAHAVLEAAKVLRRDRIRAPHMCSHHHKDDAQHDPSPELDRLPEGAQALTHAGIRRIRSARLIALAHTIVGVGAGAQVAQQEPSHKKVAREDGHEEHSHT